MAQSAKQVAEIIPLPRSLAKYQAACHALAAALAVARTADEVKAIRGDAMGIQVSAKQAKNKELEADAWEIRARAERRLGQMWKEHAKIEGKAKGGGDQRSKHRGNKYPGDKATLTEIGIDKNLAKRIRVLVAMREDEFRAYVYEGRDQINHAVEARTVKTAEILEARKGYADRATKGGTVRDLIALSIRQQFAVILINPPWTFKVYSGKGKEHSAERYYDTMSLDDIKALPIHALAAENCALFIWGVWPELPGALDVIEAWGFKYKTCAFLYVKQNRSGKGLFTGMGFWTRANSEPCFLATRGAPKRLALDVPQVIMAPLGKHSEKPIEARKRIERLLAGPYLEIFARQPVKGWTTWGNEIPKTVKEAAE